MSAGLLQFGPYALAASEVFYSTRLTVGIVNLKPVRPGHVLLLPRRVAPRLKDLAPDEAADLFRAAMRVAPEVEREFGGSAITVSVQ
ncbi:hypothetical protein HK405_005935, partial [Cladochytrium tenue]